jgi:Zn-dependent M28 family amino/carboxypeptidase
VGVRNGEVFNGADDNASGTAALLAIADYFVKNRPQHSIMFVAFDAEEVGLQGARAFVANPPVAKEAIALNINMDMISRNDAGELYVAGTYSYPQLLPFVERAIPNAEVKLIAGHDRPGVGSGYDWTSQSDQGAFHAARIPFLYFGVEDHADYHRATDDFERIQLGFYTRAVRTITSVARLIDAGLN